MLTLCLLAIAAMQVAFSLGNRSFGPQRIGNLWMVSRLSTQ